MLTDPVVAEQLATSYHLDEMDDELAADEDDEDDDMMMDTGAAGGAGGSDLQRNRSFSAITPDQLAAAIAAAQAGVQAGGSGGAGGRGRNPGAAGLFGMTGRSSTRCDLPRRLKCGAIFLLHCLINLYQANINFET